MNDNEYYSLMNRPSSWQLQQKLKKQTAKKNPDINNSFQNSYNHLESRQGAADAQMLFEKKE